MNTENDILVEGRQIGDYLLTKLLYEEGGTRTWHAHQVSIDREVIVESLNTGEQDPALADAFLNDVRVKASVDHPLIGAVFQAVRNNPFCFYAREKLSDSTLQDLCDAASTLSPQNVVRITRQIAEANLYLEEQQTSTQPIQANQIFISEQHLCRLTNVAIEGIRDHSTTALDQGSIAHALIPLLETGKPGSTRTRSLLDYMENLDGKTPLTWELVRKLSEEVEQQLTDPSETQVIESPLNRAQKRKRSKLIFLTTAIALAVGILFTLGNIAANQPKKPKQRDLSAMVHIPAGSYTSHDGDSVELAEFWIDAHEITIGEYAKFLADMSLLNAQQISIYQHPEQPKEKVNHLPNHWEDLHTAAVNGTSLNGLEITPNHPVVGIDWWDAYAYSSYNRRSLPTTQQWHAALQDALKKGSNITASSWGEVDQQSEDVTSNSIYGLAGNVSEWAADISKDPSFPTQAKAPVALGSSYLKNRGDATTREWLTDSKKDTRSTRRPDLGFRCISLKNQ